MTTALRIGALALCLLFPTIMTISWVGSASDRMAEEEALASDEPSQVAVAAAADEQYCTIDLKRVLRRVLQSCGLLDAGGSTGSTARGCQPLDAKKVATMAGDDFNALFLPMKERAGIIEYEQGKAELDEQDLALIDRVFSDQRGASYFFIVARASPEGSVESNRELSRQRAEALMAHLRQRFNDPDLEREVGLLWLGEEFAQLDPQQFCQWERSSGDASACKPEDINRSAFVAWIDCRI
jgi:outer membrane protein OmpA-like peptidoglycan-associated protein